MAQEEILLSSELEREKFNNLEFREQICLLGKYLKHKNLPDYLQPQLKEWVDLLMHASKCKKKLCHYPNCSKGKELCRHLFITCPKEKGCELCFSTPYVVKFHAQDCTQSKCTLLGCREYKKHQERRRRKTEKKNEARLSGLRKREVRLRRFYDRQMYESLRASVAAVLRLSAKGEESKHNDVKKLLGSIFYVFRLCLGKSKSWSQQNERRSEEVKK